MGATQSLSKPYWPLLDRTARLGTIRCSDVFYYPLRSLGQGFQALKVYGTTDDAAGVLEALTDLTIAIETYSRGIAPFPDLAVLIDRRNLVQHNLMSLPTADELEYGEVSSVYLYEAVRYAAIIYSVAVTFPLPPMTGVYEKLTSLLKAVLEESRLDICWTIYPKTLLWILVLGGIASSVTLDRSWYVKNLAAVSAALNILQWDDAVQELGQYLWLERTCDAGGRSVWLEAMREGALTNVFGDDC